ncbi:hypothetical protein ACGYLV_04320 [Sulfitobacter sp. M21595]|uniref:hypothetical protein n=1 Tax=unclassified Sulfitobacter TaxID=196795 RepID=UPI0037461B37
MSRSYGFEGCRALSEWLDVIDLRFSDDPAPIGTVQAVMTFVKIHKLSCHQYPYAWGEHHSGAVASACTISAIRIPDVTGDSSILAASETIRIIIFDEAISGYGRTYRTSLTTKGTKTSSFGFAAGITSFPCLISQRQADNRLDKTAYRPATSSNVASRSSVSTNIRAFA